MTASRLSNNNTLGGLALLWFGAAYLYTGSSYPLGTLRSMGAGYFPLLIGLLIVLNGAVIMLRGLVWGGKALTIAWRPMIAISASIAAFGLAIALFGLAAAILAAVAISALAERPIAPSRIAVLTVTLIALAYGVFVVILGMPIPLVRMP